MDEGRHIPQTRKQNFENIGFFVLYLYYHSIFWGLCGVTVSAVLFVSLNKNKYSVSTFLTQDHVLDTDEGDLNDAGTTKIRPINIGYGSY